MESVRDKMYKKLVNLTYRLDTLLMNQLSDEEGVELELVFYNQFYDSFQSKVGDEIQENLKFDMKYNYSEP